MLGLQKTEVGKTLSSAVLPMLDANTKADAASGVVVTSQSAAPITTNAQLHAAPTMVVGAQPQPQPQQPAATSTGQSQPPQVVPQRDYNPDAVSSNSDRANAPSSQPARYLGGHPHVLRAGNLCAGVVT